MKNIKLKHTIVFFLIILMAFATLIGSYTLARADGETTYTSVLEDLQKDSSFNVEDYPETTVNTLKVIQVAESSDHELFLYVYNPFAWRQPLIASSVRFSTAIGEDLAPLDYSLTLLSRDGVFSKYIVNDFRVLPDFVRYYLIVALLHPYSLDIDGELENDNVIKETPIEVGELWTAVTVKDTVVYEKKQEEVITITDRWDGFLEYSNGFTLYTTGACRSHFIAFNTDKPIERLIEADVSFYYNNYKKNITHFFGFPYKEEVFLLDSYKEPSLTVTCKEKGKNQANKWFATSYTWDRIQTVDNFLAEKDVTFSAEAKKNLQDKAWVLRFYESEFSDVLLGGTSTSSYRQHFYTEVTDVTVLRLHFETDGISYNLGVVSDVRDHDGVPDGSSNDDFLDKLKMILSVILVLVVIACLFSFAGPIVIPIFGLLFKLLWWIICFPFNIIGWIAKVIRKKKKK